MGKNLTRQTFDVNGTFTAPAGVTSVKIMAFSNLNPQIAFGGGNQHLLTIANAAYALGSCGGSAASGQLGNGSATGSFSTPTAVAGSYAWRQIARSYSGGCGIITSGAAYSWGGNSAGELGTGTTGSSTSSQSTPVAVTGGFSWRQLSGGSSQLTFSGYYLGITTSGVAYAWGGNSTNCLGTGDMYGTVNARSTPTIVAGGLTWKKVQAASGFSLGITTGGITYAWGGNNDGQLGNSGTTGSSTPVTVSGGYTFIEIAGSYNFSSYGITNTHDLYAWGGNQFGQLGVGDVISRSTPTLVLGGLKWRRVVAGSDFVLGITTSGDAYAWGNNGVGQLGNNDASLVPRSSPVLIAGSLKWRSIGADQLAATGLGIGPAAAGIATNGNAYSWGNNSFGNLGINNSSGLFSVSSPNLIQGGNIWNAVDSQLLGEQIISVIPGTSYPVTLFAGFLQLGPASLYGDSPNYVGSVPANIVVEYFS